MTADHCFVDGLGQVVSGRGQMKNGWIGYFDWFPDYSVRVDDILSNGNVVGLFGTAQGTYSVNGKLLLRNHLGNSSGVEGCNSRCVRVRVARLC